jgi:hypothetical protein
MAGKGDQYKNSSETVRQTKLRTDHPSQGGKREGNTGTTPSSLKVPLVLLRISSSSLSKTTDFSHMIFHPRRIYL